MTSGPMRAGALPPDRPRRLDLSRLSGELTARIDGYRLRSGDDTWEASPGDRADEITLMRLTQDGAAETRTIRIHLEERP